MNNVILCSAFVFVTDKLPSEVRNGIGKSAAFIPTAAEHYEEKSWMEADYQKLAELGYRVEMVDVKGKTINETKVALQGKDVVFVGGGNTFTLMHYARLSGFDTVVKEFVAQGVWYIGSSAGAVAAGPNIEPVKYFDDPGEVPELKDYAGLGLVDFVVLPHYGKEKYQAVFNTVQQEFQDRYRLITLTDEEVITIKDNSFSKL